MQIKTQRLTLEPLGTKFLVSTHAYASDPELTRLMVFLPTDDLAETERYLKKCEAEAAKERPQFYETAVLLDGIAARIEEELGRPATLVVTGGLAKYVTPLCRHPLTYDPELLLKGLALLYQLNAPQQHHHPAGGRKPHGQNFRRHRPFRRERHETEAKAG